MIFIRIDGHGIGIPLLLLNFSIVDGFAHLDIMIIELLLFFDEIFFILLDSELLVKILSIDWWIHSKFVFWLFDYSFSHFVLRQVLVILIFQVHFENSVDGILDVGPLVGEEF